MTNADRVYDAIVELTRELGYPPTWEELRVRLGLKSRSTVDYWLWNLRDQKRVTWEYNGRRTLRTLERLPEPVEKA